MRYWNDTWRKEFMESILRDVPEEIKNHLADASSEPVAEDNTMDEEALRLAAIEESRRKLAELEKDRPLWEEAARRRRAHEQAEEEARRARREEERRAAEAEEKRRRTAAAQAEAERRARAAREQAAREQAAREQEKRRKQQQNQRWSHGLWTTQRALERYKSLCEAFDNAKFTPSDPVTLEIVPWPVLSSPATLAAEDIDWAAVEAFFKAAKPHMRSQDYKIFVEKSHKRFHPDRWRARGLLRSVQDEETRNCLEVAANTVAQAITPLWREVKES